MFTWWSELDFSNAFDSVRHSTLIQKLAQFPIPACVHNWFIEYSLKSSSYKSSSFKSSS